MMALTLCLFVTIATVPMIAGADAEKPEATKATKRSGMPSFKPTNVGTPTTRLGGATRSADNATARAEALVPEEAGHTLSAQPVLYWHLSAKSDERVDFALIGVDPINPMLEVTLQGPFEAGIHRIDVADHGVKLETGVSYQWFVRVIPNPEQRLFDRVVGGGIERQKLTPELEAKLAAAVPEDTHYVLAEAGIWYDALDQLEAQIEADPKNQSLLAQRASLFEQVGLENLN
jgi:hypothetical protein